LESGAVNFVLLLIHLISTFQVHVPPVCMLDGVHSQHFFGTGVIVYHSDCLGLIAVDRNTIAVSISDIMLSFAAYPIEIPGEV
jgi:pro-apoptotic serine protease NMA111